MEAFSQSSVPADLLKLSVMHWFVHSALRARPDLFAFTQSDICDYELKAHQSSCKIENTLAVLY